MHSQPKIEILMTSYNHAPYLTQQLDSILSQSWDNWHLTISDNCSTDDSMKILHRYEKEHKDKVKLVPGLGKFPENHFNLVATAPDSDYYAFCDSDDIWFPEKLSIAIKKLIKYKQDVPILYGARMKKIDSNGNVYDGLVPSNVRLQPCFGNSLVEGFACEPTFLFNRQAKELIVLGLNRGLSKLVFDLFAYIIVCGAGGLVILDHHVTMFYRLHATNMWNQKGGVFPFLSRVFRVIAGHNPGKEQRLEITSVLSSLSHCLTPENRSRLMAFRELTMGSCNPLSRMMLVHKAGLCRQNYFESFFLYIMALLNRI